MGAVASANVTMLSIMLQELHYVKTNIILISLFRIVPHYCYIMPKPGYKSITVSEYVYKKFFKAYEKNHTELAYVLETPNEPGEAQQELGQIKVEELKELNQL
jgi:hypothetical protein